jgi:hypothetical protein
MLTSTSTATDEDRAPLRLANNRLLASLPDDDQLQLAEKCETVRVENGQLLTEPGQPMPYVYFPIDCLVSLLGVAQGRMTLEVGLLGREGMLGASLAQGELAQVRAVVQRSGRAYRMAAADFVAEFERMESLQHLLQRYTGVLAGASDPDRRVQPLPCAGSAAGALAADDARPSAIGQIPPDPRVPRPCTGRAARRRHQGGQRAAAAKADYLQPRQHRDPRRGRAGSGFLPLLRSVQGK